MALTKVRGAGVGSLDAITIGDGTAADKKYYLTAMLKIFILV